jgi:peptide/nickel transport system substrate-binding protein
VAQAKQLLRDAGFSWNSNGSLNDGRGRPVEFSIMHNAGRAQQVQMATLIQQDLKDVGIKVNLVPLDFASLVDRVFNNFRYEAAIMTLADGDADPNSEMSVWRSNGATHIWKLQSAGLPDKWQQDIDRLMEEQMTTRERSRRKQIFDKVQELVWKHKPVIFLVSPDILAGASDRVGNFQPTVLSSYTLWNADRLFLRKQGSGPN